MSDAMVDEVAQKLYLASMLGNPALFARVQHLVKASYFDGKFQPMVQFLKEFYHTKRGVPTQQVLFAATKVDLEPVVLPKQDASFVSEQIAMFCQIRAVTEAVLNAPMLMQKGDFGKMVADIKAATQVQLHSDLGINYFENYHERLEHVEESEQVISTGWDTVDEMIGGGVGRQELVLYTANSGGGKSVAMLNHGYNLLKQGLSGVYISLEMKDSVVAKRLDSMISRIAGKDIKMNLLKVGEQIDLFKGGEIKGQFFIKRMREGSTTADDIISYLRELEAVYGFKPDFVVVDYIDLMASVQKHDGANMFTKDKYVTEEVRAIGFDFDCLMISASQLGRGAIVATREQTSIGQDHIQGGISKINTADLVIALVKDEAMDAAGEYRFEFLKSRNSNAVNKKLVMAWDHQSLRITDAGLKLASRHEGKPIKPKGKVMQLGDVTPGKTASGFDELLGRS